ncbi:MBL fold metallo-hydrolase [Thalassotalea sp. HSM 43]|uniref:MBL fold metallo-hydrolase n=1 Tax=Thalassotalea sp. HSM 43 TaxID=2552945 RepID=UPI001080365D|nr:MBL fold metallo-hydrolase [Thalassotalea sp. HSM 43]QBY05996.1 MBL fold metallo-hydrolase [Thalassotalea sp. HSM 43]
MTIAVAMKSHITIALLFVVSACASQPAIDVSEQTGAMQLESVLTKQNWMHGSVNCDDNTDPSQDVYKHNATTFIVRQNKCLNFEAPFMYILVGKEKILLLDTGALSDNSEFSFQQQITDIVGKDVLSDRELLVVHSHSHSDHYQGDSSLATLSNVHIVKPSASDVQQAFEFTNWPDGEKTIDLGDRKITVLPTPGHQEEAITVYDEHTKWLLTGDTLYPGYIYVKNWQSYRNSIAKLVTFANNHAVSAIMGAHIEMKQLPGEYYPIGATYQPNETQLDLSVQSMNNLNQQLQMYKEPTKIIFNDFIVEPMSGFQKTISNAARWITQ